MNAIDHKAAYNALSARDRRFDGLFFVGVSSTKIYCRPICTAKTPLYKNCSFFSTAAAAEKAGFRPCLRCRPELAPGNAPIDGAHRITQLFLAHLDEAFNDSDGTKLEQIAHRMGMSSRQLRRVIQNELGVTPIELIQTRRLLLAKQLLTETALPITQIALASGFASVRRFNAMFKQRYDLSPSSLRNTTIEHQQSISNHQTSALLLAYRPPYDWQTILNFLAARAIQQIEFVSESCYARTVCIGSHTGYVQVTHIPKRNALQVVFSHSLLPVLSLMLTRLRQLFDLEARPDLIDAHLAKNKWLKKSVATCPGMRVPGAFDGFEMALRAILGQQISVKAATTLACRFAEKFGVPIVTPFPELSRLSPQAEHLANVTPEEIAQLGIVKTRAKSILALAEACHKHGLRLEPGMEPLEATKQLIVLPGIGPWTAHYIAMRALRWPDAFPKEDIAIRNKLGGVSAQQAEAISQVWRPWRSYAVIRCWHLTAPIS